MEIIGYLIMTLLKQPVARPTISFEDTESETKQSFKDECDINNIVNKFQTTGILPSNILQNPQYGEAPNMDLKTAIDLTQKLKNDFDNLTPDQRVIFDNDFEIYGQFLDEFDRSPESFSELMENESDTLMSHEQNSTSQEDSGAPRAPESE